MSKNHISLFSKITSGSACAALAAVLFSCAGFNDSQKTDLTLNLPDLRAIPEDLNASENSKFTVSVTGSGISQTKDIAAYTYSLVEGKTVPTAVEKATATFEDIPVGKDITVSMNFSNPDSYQIPEDSGLSGINNQTLNNSVLREKEANPSDRYNYFYKPVYSASTTINTKAGENNVNLTLTKQDNAAILANVSSKNSALSELYFIESQYASGSEITFLDYTDDYAFAIIKCGLVVPCINYFDSNWQATTKSSGSSGRIYYKNNNISDAFVEYCSEDSAEDSKTQVLYFKKLERTNDLTAAFEGKFWTNTDAITGDSATYSYFYFENASKVHIGNSVYENDTQTVTPTGVYTPEFYKAGSAYFLKLGTNLYNITIPENNAAGSLYLSSAAFFKPGESEEEKIYSWNPTEESLGKSISSFTFDKIDLDAGLYLDADHGRYLYINSDGTATAGRGMNFDTLKNETSAVIEKLNDSIGFATLGQQEWKNKAKSDDSRVAFKNYFATRTPVYAPADALTGSVMASSTTLTLNGIPFKLTKHGDTLEVYRDKTGYSWTNGIDSNNTLKLTKVTDSSIVDAWNKMTAGKYYVYSSTMDEVDSGSGIIQDSPTEIGSAITNANTSPALIFFDEDNSFCPSDTQTELININPTVQIKVYITSRKYNEGKTETYNITNPSNSTATTLITANNADIYAYDATFTNARESGASAICTTTSYKDDNNNEIKCGNIYLYGTTIQGFKAQKGSAALAGTDYGQCKSIFLCDGCTIGGENGKNSTTGSSTTDGGALYAGNVFMLGGTVSYNTSDYYGGGIWADDFYMMGGTISNNTATRYGGGVLVNSRMNIYNGTIESNLTESLADYCGGAGLANISAQYSDDNNGNRDCTIGLPNATNPSGWSVTFTGNHIKNSGGTYNISGAAVLAMSVNLTVNDSATFRNNGTYEVDGTSYSTNGGGAIAISGNANAAYTPMTQPGKITINGGTFTGNKAVTGGAIGCDAAGTYLTSITINGGIFTNNEATYGGAVSNCTCGTTGSYLNAMSKLEINSGTFENNIASTDGGAVYYRKPNNYSGVEISINGGTFNNNIANTNGGAICFRSVEASNCLTTLVIGSESSTPTFERNSAAKGGAIAVLETMGDSPVLPECSKLNILAGTFNENGVGTYADNSTKYAKYGGAVYSEVPVTVSGGKFIGNKITTTLNSGIYGAAFCINQYGTVNSNNRLGSLKITSNSVVIGGNSISKQNIRQTGNDEGLINDISWLYDDDDAVPNVDSCFENASYESTVLKNFGTDQNFEAIKLTADLD